MSPSMDYNTMAKAFGHVPKLSGRDDFEAWQTTLDDALLKSETKVYVDGTLTDTMAQDNIKNDLKVAASILFTLSTPVLKEHIHFADKTQSYEGAVRSKTLYDKLVADFGTTPGEKSNRLIRALLESKPGKDRGITEWLKNVVDQCDELQAGGFTAHTLGLNVALAGLSSTHESFVTAFLRKPRSKPPTIEDLALELKALEAQDAAGGAAGPSTSAARGPSRGKPKHNNKGKGNKDKSKDKDINKGKGKGKASQPGGNLDPSEPVKVTGRTTFLAPSDPSDEDDELWVFDTAPANTNNHPLNTLATVQQAPQFTHSTRATLNDWHRRLGHLNGPAVNRLLGGLSTGGSIARSAKGADDPCDSCLPEIVARPRSPPLPGWTRCPDDNESPIASNILDKVDIDLLEVGTKSSGGAQYMLLMVDEATRYSWLYLLRERSEGPAKLKAWLEMVEAQFGRRVKSFRSEDCDEFTTPPYKRYYREKGITHPTVFRQTCVASVANRSILRHAISTMHAERLPLTLWAAVVNAIVYVKNRSPCKPPHTATPYQLVFKTKPNLSHLHVIGAPAWAVIGTARHNGREYPRAVRCLFLGYNEDSWRFYNPVTQKVHSSNQAIFDEQVATPKKARKPISLPELEEALVTPLPELVYSWEDDDVY